MMAKMMERVEALETEMAALREENQKLKRVDQQHVGDLRNDRGFGSGGPEASLRVDGQVELRTSYMGKVSSTLIDVPSGYPTGQLHQCWMVIVGEVNKKLMITGGVRYSIAMKLIS